MGKSKGKGRPSKGGSSEGRFRERHYRHHPTDGKSEELEDGFAKVSIGDQNEEIVDDDESGPENTEDMAVISASEFSVRLYMWEFGQNDPKRYSSKNSRIYCN